MRMIDESVIDSVVDTLKSNRLFRYDCERPEESATSLLEKRLCEVVGVRYAVAMNSCSSSLFVALVASGLKPGAKVLIPAFTFIAVPSSIVHAGAIPVLVEVTDDYVIDLDDLEAKITPETTHLLLSYMRGRVPDMDRVLEICTRRGVTLVEDSAHSLGVLWDGVQTGKLGVAGAYSAQSYKMVDGGEGGILVTDDKDVAYRSMLYAGCYEKNWAKHFVEADDGELIDAMVNSIPAYNFRMSNLSAAAILPQLDQIDARVERFNANFEAIASILRDSPHVRVPEFTPKVRPAADSIQFEMLGLSDEQMGLATKKLMAEGVKLGVFGMGSKNARCFWNWTFFERGEDCPKTRELLNRTADMRLRLHLSREDVETAGRKIVATLRDVA